MKTTTIIQALGPIDFASIRRDPMLRWMVFLPLVIALAMRLALPLIVARIDPWFPWELAALYPPLMAYMVLLLVPYLWGVIVGFLLLDQRDDRTLSALQVTPLSLAGYLRYRLLLPTLLTVFSAPLALALTGLASLDPGAHLLLALAVAPQAPLAALALAALAQNKVQGLALMKVANVVLLPPLVAYFLPAAWQQLFLLVPTTWPAYLLWELQSDGTGAWFYLVGGLLYQGGLLWWLARRFQRIMVH